MEFPAALASIGGTFTVCFLAYLYHRSDRHKRELAHAERMKSLESGQPLPDKDIAWAGTESTRIGVAALVGVFVPLFVIGGALGATAMVFAQGRSYDFEPSWIAPLLYVIWGVCGLVSLVTVALSLSAIRRRRGPGEAASASSTSAKPRFADHDGNIDNPTSSYVASEKLP